MAKMQIKINSRGMRELLLSAEVAEGLAPYAARVEAAAKSDPNAYYRSTIRTTEHRSRGRLGRVSKRVGARPGIGEAVETKRQTLAKAIGAV